MGATQPAAPSTKRVTSPGMVAPVIPEPPPPPPPAAIAAPPLVAAPAHAAPPPVPPPIVLQPAAAAPSQRGLMIALALVACLAGAAIAISLVNKPPPAAAPAQFRVVTQHIEPPAAVVTAAPVEPAAKAAEPEPAAAEPAADPPASDEPAASRPDRARAAKRGGPDAQALTRAFRNQQPKIETCFTEHAVGLQGHPQMQVDFDLDARGKLVKVAVAPAALATTALGTCIEHVARATTFPAQGEPVSFSIPVTASRVPGR
jgi:hypothetical protein